MITEDECVPILRAIESTIQRPDLIPCLILIDTTDNSIRVMVPDGINQQACVELARESYTTAKETSISGFIDTRDETTKARTGQA